MSSRRNNIPPTFVLPPHFSGSGEWNGALQPHHGPQAHSTQSGLAHPTSYNVANIEHSRSGNGEGYNVDNYYGNPHMSNRAATVPYRRTPPTQTQHPVMLTTSPVELSLPSHQETEIWLRNHLKIPAPRPLTLLCLQNITDVRKLPNLTDMIFLAIWGSPFKRLGLSEIYAVIENRYPALKAYEDKAWQRSIRHRLSLKACFVRIRRDRRGADWMIDVSKGLENSRGYKTPPQQNTSGSSSDSHSQLEDDSTSPFMGYSSDSDAFLTPPPEMSTAIQDYTFMGSANSIPDLSGKMMTTSYNHIPY